MKKLLLILLGVFMYAFGNNVLAVNHFDYTPEQIVIELSDDALVLDSGELQVATFSFSAEKIYNSKQGGYLSDILKYPNTKLDRLYYKKALKQKNNRVNNLQYTVIGYKSNKLQKNSIKTLVRDLQQKRGYFYPLLCYTEQNTHSLDLFRSNETNLKIKGRLFEKQFFSTEQTQVA